MTLTPSTETQFRLKLLTIGFFILLSIFLVGIQIYQQHQRLQDSQHWVMHTLEVQNAASELLLTAIDGSGAIRGYVISSNQAFLLPYQHMLDNLNPRFNTLVKLTADNLVQQQHVANLQPLIQQRLEESALLVRLYQEQGQQTAMARITQGQSLEINKQLRQLIGAIHQEEENLLHSRETILKLEAQRSLNINTLLIAVFVVFALIVLWALVREWRHRNQHLRERELLNAELDTRNANLQAANIALHQADRIKNEFLSAMSHELRTPLNSIIGFTGLLRMRIPGPLNDEQIKQLNLVDDSAKHLLHLINDLLDLSRIEAGRASLDKEHVALQDVIKDAFATVLPMANQKGLSLQVECGNDAITLHTDRRKLYQILLNLINNAVKFSDHGTITVTCRSWEAVCEVSVSDQGIGIRPEQMALLFQAFRQAEGSVRRVYEGTGLGLYLSKKLADMLGGSIRAESQYGQGSRFVLTLPLPTQGDAP